MRTTRLRDRTSQAGSHSAGCNILVKAEQLNPGGSVKDRAAAFLIKDAEEKGMRRQGTQQLPTCRLIRSAIPQD